MVRVMRTMQSLSALCAMVLLGACGRVPEEAWQAEASEASCRTLRRCDPITYHRYYTDLDSCIEVTEVPVPELASCRYDEKAAHDCLRALDWSCARLGRDHALRVETCNAVWDCAATGTGDTGGTVPPL